MRKVTEGKALRGAALVLVAVLVALAALPSASAAATRPASLAARQAAPATLRSVTVGMGYVPSVQFAPFYVADQRGYYRRAGLDVHFNYAASPNLLELVGTGKMDFANADGTDVIAASAQGIPVLYAAAEYQSLPNAIFALAKEHIRSVADLRGKTIGVPGRYGANWVGLLAALHAAGLRPSDVKIETIGYSQDESVATGKVDAAVGYSTNEPLLLARHGYKVTTLEVGSVTHLVGPGIVTGRALAAHDPALVRAFVQATLHGLADTINDPRMAFAVSRTVHGLNTLHGTEVGDQYAVLLRAIDFWHSTATRAHGLGYADPAQWQSSTRLLRTIGQIPTTPNVGAMVSNTFSAGAPKE